jgi:glyoxylase-like metal-dependent hydrolase (beta-lactamase superfamily II)
MFVVDPGASAKQLADRIRAANLTPVAILLTHGHFDHAGGAAELAGAFHIPVYAFEKERETLEDPARNLSTWDGEQLSYHADIYLQDEQEIELAGFSIRVLFTPGHTSGGCCYYLKEERALFAGDTLFAQSVGRTDFPGGSASQIIRSIQEKLMVLPDDVTVYTGHEDITTIGTERKYNPYL